MPLVLYKVISRFKQFNIIWLAFRMMSSMAKIFREGNLTYSPYEMDFSSGDIIQDLKREVGNEHSSKFTHYSRITLFHAKMQDK